MGCNIAPSNIQAEESCKTTGGMSKKLYYALPADIDSPFPAPPASPASFSEAVTVVADFTMVATKTFFTIDADVQSSSLESASEGEMNNLSSKSDYKFIISGESKSLAGFLNSYRNKDLILVAPDNDGTQRLLGNPTLPAKISAFSEMSGTKVGDNKQFEVTISAYGNLPFYFEGPAGVPLA